MPEDETNGRDDERGWVIYSPIARILSGGRRGITLYPFILMVPEVRDNVVILNHERIHIEQQRELYIVGFYVLYVGYWLRGLLTGADDAYRSIPFEREAYGKERDLGYLSFRKPHSWRQY
jgi:hypothetical protein